MKIYQLIFICLLYFPLWVQAQDQPQWMFLTIPDTLLQDANAVVREEVVKFEVRDEKSGRLYVREVITILNDKSRQNEITIPYDADSKIKGIEIKLYDGLGRFIREVDKDEITDRSAIGYSTMYDDSRVKQIKIAYSEYPYTIEIEYEKRLEGTYFFDYPDWFIQSYATSLQKGQFIVEMPANMALHYKALNIELEPQIKNGEKTKTYTWTAELLPAQSYTPMSPPQYEVIPILLISPDRFQFDDYSGSMASWKDFGAFVYNLFEGRDKLPAETATEVRSLTQGLTSNDEKIEVLYSYLKDNMRYVGVQLGIGGLQPFDAEYVSTNKYGDCKALTNFMKAMLKEAGIKSYPVLIKSGYLHYEITPEFATSEFNHVILYIPEENIWLECTSNVDPVNYLGRNNANRNALMLTENGGQIIRTPNYDVDQNIEAHRTEIDLQEDGKASIKGVVTESGAYHDTQRYLALLGDQKEKEEWFIESVSLNSPRIERLDFSASPNLPEATITYELQVNRYATKAGKRLFVPINQINDIGWVPNEDDDRIVDVVNRTGYMVEDSIIIKLPKDYHVESIANNDLLIDQPYGKYELKIVERPGEVIAYRKAEMKAFRVPASEFEAYRSFMKEVTKAEKTKVVLVKRKT